MIEWLFWLIDSPSNYLLRQPRRVSICRLAHTSPHRAWGEAKVFVSEVAPSWASQVGQRMVQPSSVEGQSTCYCAFELAS